MFFELRLEYYYLGINYENIVIMDKRDYVRIQGDLNNQTNMNRKLSIQRNLTRFRGVTNKTFCVYMSLMGVANGHMSW